MRTRARPRFERRTWWAAFLALFVVGVAWTMAMPLGFQPDETQHAMRAAAVARGQVTWKYKEEIRLPHFFDVRRTNTVVEVPEGYASLEDVPVCVAIVDGQDASCAPAISNSRTIVEARPYTGTYPPLSAIIAAPGGWFAAPVGLVVMRLCTMAASSALLASAFVATRRMGGGAVAVGLALAVTPVVLSLCAAINPSAIEIAAAICFWASAIDVVRPGPVDRRAVWRAVVSASAFALSRPLSPVLLLLAVAVLAIAMPWRDRLRTLRQQQRSWMWLGWLGASLVTAVGWVAWARPEFVGYDDNLTLRAEIRESLARIPWRMRQLVGYLGWLSIELPGALSWCWLGAIGVLGSWAAAISRWRRRLAFAVLLFGIVLGPSLGELPTSKEFGLIWQGRYTLPFAVGLPLLTGWTLHEKGLDRSPAIRRTGLAVVVGTVIVHLAAFATALTRNATGRSWPFSFPWGGQPWSADVRGWVVMTVAAVGLAGLAVVLGRFVLRPRRVDGEAAVC